MHSFFLFLAAFLASAVEVVEMMTILLGVGMTAGWRPTLLGAGAGFVVLVAVVAALTSALAAVPMDVLRATIGILLLLFGVQWLRKGIWRIGLYGLRPPEHRKVGGREPIDPGKMDWTAGVIAFKGVLLEGLEVVIIVVTFGAATERLGLAIGAALAAFAVIAVIALILSTALSGIPEHVIKFAVGLLLAAYGTFWAGEGLGVKWPGEDMAILAILAVYLLYSVICFSLLRRMVAPGDGIVPGKTL